MQEEQEICVKMRECLDELWTRTDEAKSIVKKRKGNSWRTTALLLFSQYEEALNELAELNSRVEHVLGLKPGDDGFSLLVKKR